MRRLRAQTRVEIVLSLRRRENLFVTIFVPAAILAFFSLIPILPTPSVDPMEFLLPGTLTLAIIATSLVANGISTGFDRSYLVLKRLGSTPLRKIDLIAAKGAAIALGELITALVLFGIAMSLGWRPTEMRPGILVIGIIGGTAAFGSIGMFLAGVLKAETNLAVANALFLALLLVGGILIPLASLPTGLARIASVIPAKPLAEIIGSGLGYTAASSGAFYLVAGWAAAGTLLAAATFRWE
jgi:ABC-2 type transport system permease protein